jgi:hypothetical protein
MKPPLLAVLLLLPTALQAADRPEHNTLTEKEIRDGWILLFDGKTIFGWTSPNGSKWSVVDGQLYPQKGKPGVLVTTTAFRDYELSVDYQKSAEGYLNPGLLCDQEGKGGYQALLGTPHSGRAGRWHVQVIVEKGKIKSGIVTGLSGKVKARVAIADKSSPTPTQPRHISLNGTECIVYSVKLRPLNTKPLLNGKDLSGWKVHPGLKSQFTITKDGELSLKNGRGDLQSEGQWDDFVLQLECKTLGKNLNSGVFFRCLPGEYQMGYEAQIHNGFGKPKEYTLEDYDPKTHKLLGKRKEKYDAIDYGTGSIYRRQPARLQAAKDGEWFTMTVVASGRHFATWVNGVQTCDWTDNRPLAPNARTGAYLKKGPISIQGHDPTTDLLFRNLRIAGLRSK